MGTYHVRILYCFLRPYERKNLHRRSMNYVAEIAEHMELWAYDRRGKYCASCRTLFLSHSTTHTNSGDSGCYTLWFQVTKLWVFS